MRALVSDYPRIPATVATALGARPGDSYVDLALQVGDEHVVIRLPLAWTALQSGGLRPWWICPRCSARRYHLVITGDGGAGRVACRTDLGLYYRGWRDHRTRHYEQVVRPMLVERRAGSRAQQQ